MPEIWLILRISPAGFRSSTIEFRESKPELAEVARGEGQVLAFKLEAWDCSPLFAERLYDGAVLDKLQAKLYDINLDEEKP